MNIKKYRVLLALTTTLVGSLVLQTSAEAGSLGFTSVPSNFTFPSVTLDGTTHTPVYNQVWKITDTTGNNAGWNLQLTATPLTNAAGATLGQPTIPAYVPAETCDAVQPGPANASATRVYGQGGSFTSASVVSSTGLFNPVGDAVDSSKNLYVVDNSNQRVLYYAFGSTTATRVWGQGGSFTTATANKGGISANSLAYPRGVAVDSGGNVYIADTNNNRVLYYPAGTTTATRVYGQAGSFTTATANNGGITANSLSGPTAVGVDSTGNPYIVDNGNNRVLFYSGVSTTATRVYGQGGSFTTATNGTPATANNLWSPENVTLDSSNNVYISDYNNNRVLFYSGVSTTATRVYGQGGSFTTGTGNNGGITANSLFNPHGIRIDSTGNLYITDTGNNRVLFYSGVSTTATRVYGQGGSFTTGNTGSPATSTNLWSPLDVTVDSSNNVYIVDNGNNRVLSYVSPSTTATGVYGQGGSFTNSVGNEPNANSINSAGGEAIDSSGNLYVADTGNNRVLYYPAGTTTATRVYGQGGNFASATQNNGGISANSLWGPSGVALDSSGNLYVADTKNNRVLYYTAGSTTATRVYGQGGNFTTTTSNNGGVSANSLFNPYTVSVDSSGNVYIDDANNSRILYYVGASTTATRVYGQGGVMTSNAANNGGITANSLYNPYGATLDSSGNLYVADSFNYRVLYYTAGSTTATRVYGQGGSFTTANSNNLGVTADSLSIPYGPAVDVSGNLYIPDSSNNRVLTYAAGSTTANRVYGQGGNFTTSASNNGGISASSLYNPLGVAVDSSGNLYIADDYNSRVLYNPTCVAATNPGNITYPLVLPTSATKILNASANTGFGAGTYNIQSFQLTIPPTARAGSYSATWTLALTSGP